MNSQLYKISIEQNTAFPVDSSRVVLVKVAFCFATISIFSCYCYAFSASVNPKSRKKAYSRKVKNQVKAFTSFALE